MRIAAVLTASAISTAAACLALAKGGGRPAALNYRGVRIPVVLGIAVAAGATVGAAVAMLTGPGESGVSLRVSIATGVVFLAGLVDDLVPGGPRGLRGHLRALASGRMTTGILKVFVVAAASVVVAAVLPGRPFPVEVAGVVTMAACANLWNGLDVAPGRSIKAFLVAGGAAVLAGVGVETAPAVPAAFAAAAVALPFDLRERAMLGDGGANLLGFAAGLGLYLVLPGWGVGVGAAAAVGLNLVAETVTLSRIIAATPPLRWADGLGRLRPGVGA